MQDSDKHRYSPSEPFKFIIGSEQKEFYLHSHLVATQSPKLEALVHSGLKESQEHCVRWETEELETFFRFGQFLYTATYDASKPLPGPKYETTSHLTRPQEVTSQDYSPVEASDRTVTASLPRKPKLEPTMSTHLWPRFKKLYKRMNSPNSQGDSSAESNRSTEQYDHAEVFLSHAKVYVFADYHGIEVLKDLALRKLHDALKHFELTDDGLQAIAELTKYSFDNTVVGDRLTEMVQLYAACYLAHSWKHEAFRTVVDDSDFYRSLITLALTPGHLN